MELKRRKSDSQHNGKVSIREVYDIVYPMKEDIAVIKTKVHIIKEDVNNLKECIGSKISIKAFATWLSVTTGLLLIVFTILGFYYRGI